jgi:hypothetical protein
MISSLVIGRLLVYAAHKNNREQGQGQGIIPLFRPAARREAKNKSSGRRDFEYNLKIFYPLL